MSQNSSFRAALGISFAEPIIAPKGFADIWAIPFTAGFEEIGILRVNADGTVLITPYKGVIERSQIAKLEAAAIHALYGPAVTMYGTWTEAHDEEGELAYVETIVSVPRFTRN